MASPPPSTPPSTPAYPVYRSPDGQSEQVAPTPTREVQLRYAGWTKITQPRKRTADAPKPDQAQG